MLKFVILHTNSRNETNLAIARGETLEISEHNFRNSIKNNIEKFMPVKGWIFRRKKWKSDEIRIAIEKAISEVSADLKRKTIRM